MVNKETVIREIQDAFGKNDYPGDDFLQGSFEGSEPYEEIAHFKGQDDWQKIDSELLDTHHSAPSFFSEAGLRFFLPAYLIADLRGELQTADPLFVLVHGFSNLSVNIPVKSRIFVRTTGKSAFVNPNRYGAMTLYDYARCRLSVFTREEARALVSYLRYKQDSEEGRLHSKEIDAALDLFWLDRAENGPPAASLAEHLSEEAEFLAAISSDMEE